MLVTDGDQRAALAVVRSLGAAGHMVFVCSATGRSLSGASRWSVTEFRVSDPLTAPEAFLANVRALAREHRIDALMPISEAALLAILPHRDELPGVCIPFVDAATFRRICDKQAVLEAAANVGIPTPEQHVLITATDAATFDVASVRFPIVVKPARSVSGAAGHRVKTAVQHAASPAQLQRILHATDPVSYPLLVQRRIVGPGIGIFVLIRGGSVIASFSHRRIREKPPSGGVSVYRESIPADPDLVARSVALLSCFDWEGVAMIEYKIDRDTGSAYLMEINGRFWGSLQLAVDAGVDFPRLLLAGCTKSPPTPVVSYKQGVRLRWFWGEVDHLIARIRFTNLELDLPDDEQHRVTALGAFLRRRRGDRSEILRWDDPMPFVRETRLWFRQIARGR